MESIIIAASLLAVFFAYCGHRWWDERNATRARANLIAGTHTEAEAYRAVDGMTPTQRRYVASQQPPAPKPVEKPPALTAPPADIDLDDPDLVENYAAEGIATLQYMLDKVWTQKGYGR